MNYANKIEKQRQRYYGTARSIMRKALKSINDDFLEEARRCSTPQQILIVAKKEIRDTKIREAMDRVYKKTMPFFADQAVRQLKPRKATPDNIETDYWMAYIDKFVRTRLGRRIAWITETTKDMIWQVTERVVMDAIEAGKGIDKIVKVLQSELAITERYRAERIARTEVVSASNEGSLMGAKSTDLDLYKEWISYVDDRTRESHITLNGETRSMNDTFSNGLEYPGDPAGEGEEVINCRCTIGYVERTNEIEIGREDETVSAPVSIVDLAQLVDTGFIEAKTATEAQERMISAGVEFADVAKWDKSHYNAMLEAVEGTPKKANPTNITDGAGLVKITGRPLGRAADMWYGVSMESEKYIAGEYKLYKNVAINTRKYKTTASVTQKKIEFNKYYLNKTGNEYFFNTDGRLTHFHELGHVQGIPYGKMDEWERLAHDWYRSVKIGNLKSESEAFAEAFADIYGNKGGRVPSYIKDFFTKYVK